MAGYFTYAVTYTYENLTSTKYYVIPQSKISVKYSSGTKTTHTVYGTTTQTSSENGVDVVKATMGSSSGSYVTTYYSENGTYRATATSKTRKLLGQTGVDADGYSYREEEFPFYSDVFQTLCFERDKYTYTLIFNPGSYGTGSETSISCLEDESTTLKDAIFTRTGYTQTGWSKNQDGSTKDYDLSASVTITVDLILYPFWTVKTVSVTASASPSGGGTVVASASSCAVGSSVTFTATPSSGYTLSYWTVNGTTKSSSGTTLTYTVATTDTAVAAVAYFVKKTFAVTASASPTAGGTATANKSSCTIGDTIIFTATPSSQYNLSYWTVNGTTYPASGNTLSYQVTDDTTAVAYFVLKTVSITTSASPSNGGTVTASASSCKIGDTVTFTATFNTGYSFSYWMVNGTTYSAAGGYSLQYKVTGDTTAIGYFTKNTQIGITPQEANDDGCSITTTQAMSVGKSYEGASNTEHISGTTLKVTANAVKEWVSADSFTIVRSKRVIYRDYDTGEITSDTTSEVSRTLSRDNTGEEYSYYLDNPKLYTSPFFTFADYSSTFVGNVQIVDNDTGVAFKEIIYSLVSISYNFIRYAVALSLVASPNEGGIVTGSGNYYYKSEVECTATPYSGYKFVSWSTGETDSTITHTITATSGTETITAYFEVTEPGILYSSTTGDILCAKQGLDWILARY